MKQKWINFCNEDDSESYLPAQYPISFTICDDGLLVQIISEKKYRFILTISNHYKKTFSSDDLMKLARSFSDAFTDWLKDEDDLLFSLNDKWAGIVGSLSIKKQKEV